MADYVPTTEKVRSAYAHDRLGDAGAGFDRWLNSVRAQTLRDYADLISGSTYTMNRKDAESMHANIVHLLRRDADLIAHERLGSGNE